MLSNLIHKRFNCVSRAADMLCLFLGDDYIITSPNGKKIQVAEYSLHLQTQWRFRKDDTILLASRDIYDPYCSTAPKDWQYDLVGRADAESSVFDVLVKGLTNVMQNAIVTESHLSETHDITIKFSNGIVLEQFTCASQRSEEWRLIDYKTKLHTICYDEDGTITCS